MVIWSPFILDELAGLRNDAAPELPAVRRPTRAFLAKNSGIVTALTRARTAREPAQFGEITSWAVLGGRRTRARRSSSSST